MSTFLYWFGVIHLAAYALAGFTFATAWFVNWFIHRWKLKADLYRAMHIMFQRCREERDGPFYGA